MILQAFINHLPTYLIIISIITVFTCLSITIRYSLYYISDKISFKEYVKQSINEPFGSFLEYSLFIYGMICAFCTLVYIGAALQTIGS